MKKFVSVALALIMIFALTVSVAAKDSPSAKDYYVITTATDPADGSLGTAATSKKIVAKDATGEDALVVLTATETKGYFTKWIIQGEYELLSGNTDSEEIMLFPKSDIHAIACFRVDKAYLHMTASAVGDGTASVNPAQVEVGSNDLVTFTAVDGKDTFVNWTLECEYDIVEGSLTSRKLVIRPYTDVHGIAKFESSPGSSSSPASSSTTSTPSVSSNNGSNQSTTSPKTGDPLFIIIGLAVLALSAGALAVKKVKG